MELLICFKYVIIDLSLTEFFIFTFKIEKVIQIYLNAVVSIFQTNWSQLFTIFFIHVYILNYGIKIVFYGLFLLDNFFKNGFFWYFNDNYL